VGDLGFEPKTDQLSRSQPTVLDPVVRERRGGDPSLTILTNRPKPPPEVNQSGGFEDAKIKKIASYI